MAFVNVRIIIKMEFYLLFIIIFIAIPVLILSYLKVSDKKDEIRWIHIALLIIYMVGGFYFLSWIKPLIYG